MATRRQIIQGLFGLTALARLPVLEGSPALPPEFPFRWRLDYFIERDAYVLIADCVLIDELNFGRDKILQAAVELPITAIHQQGVSLSRVMEMRRALLNAIAEPRDFPWSLGHGGLPPYGPCNIGVLPDFEIRA